MSNMPVKSYKHVRGDSNVKRKGEGKDQETSRETKVLIWPIWYFSL